MKFVAPSVRIALRIATSAGELFITILINIKDLCKITQKSGRCCYDC